MQALSLPCGPGTPRIGRCLPRSKLQSRVPRRPLISLQPSPDSKRATRSYAASSAHCRSTSAISQPITCHFCIVRASPKVGFAPVMANWRHSGECLAFARSQFDQRAGLKLGIVLAICAALADNPHRGT